MNIEKCTFENCKTILSASQAEKTKKLLGKALCQAHAQKASAETAEQNIPVDVQIRRLLENRGFEELKFKPGIFLKGDKPNQRFVDLNKKNTAGMPELGILQGAERVTEGHGIIEIDDLKIEIENIVNQKSKSRPKKEQEKPKDMKTREEPEKLILIEKENEILPVPVPVHISTPASTVSAIVRPAVTPTEAIAAWKEFNDLKQAIISDIDRQKIGDKSFIKKSGWRKLAAFFNLTDRITEEVQTRSDDRGWSWKIKVTAIAPNGRISEGVGICSTSERKFAHIEHDTYATAHTRAKNRAISDMIAGGEVSTEEIE